MMERKANAIRANALKHGDVDVVRAWAKQCRNFFTDYENGLYENAFYAPTAAIVKELEEFVTAYMNAGTYEECIEVAARYYRKAHMQKPRKIKYLRALERIEKLRTTGKA
jgi:hypothetical protein